MKKDIIKQRYLDNPNFNRQELADELEVSIRTVYRAIAETKSKKNMPKKEAVLKNVTNENGKITSEIKGIKQLPHDNESLLKLHGYDADKFILINSKSSIWDTQIKGGTVRELYSTKITVKPKEDYIDHDELSNFINKYEPKIVRPKTIKEYDKDLVLEVQAPDLHLGKMAWEGETGENYDSHVAEERYRGFINDVIEKLNYKALNPGMIIYPFGEDYIQVDNSEDTTTKGTKQDVDSRFHKTFKRGLQLKIWGIENLREYTDRIEVPLVIGNHNYNSAYHMSEVFNAHFRNYNDVNIDTSVKHRKYIKFGNCMLCLGHLDEEAKSEVHGLPMKEEPVMYGTTIHREFHSGHLHSEGVIEKNGLKWRRLPSLSGTDNWHSSKGYSSKKGAMCFLWHKEKGLQEIWYYYPSK